MQILFEVPDSIHLRLNKVLRVRGQRKAIFNSLTEQILGLIEGADDPELVIKAIITKKVRLRLNE